MYKLPSNFAVISDVNLSFIPNKSTFTKYCRTLWISTEKGRQYLLNFMGLVGIVYATVYQTKPISTGLWHGKLA